MVLQDRYAKAASRRYQRTHDPTPEQAAESAAVDAALREAERRRLGTNADRYKEDDDELQKGLGAAAGLPKEGDDEVDEEEGALTRCCVAKPFSPIRSTSASCLVC